MAGSLTYSFDGYTIDILYSKTAPILTDEPLHCFLVALTELAEAANLVSYVVLKSESPETDYTLEFITGDAREWNQVIRMTDPILISGQYDFFSAEVEVEKHQAVRRWLYGLINKYGITKIDASWT